MSNEITEMCKLDGSMTPEFLIRVNSENNFVVFVCEYTGMEVKLDTPDYRNGVLYRVKAEVER